MCGWPSQQCCLTLAAHCGSPCSVYISIYGARSSLFLRLQLSGQVMRCTWQYCFHKTLQGVRICLLSQRRAFEQNVSSSLETQDKLSRHWDTNKKEMQGTVKPWGSEQSLQNCVYFSVSLSICTGHVNGALLYSEVSITALAMPAVSDLQTGMRTAVGTSQLRILLCIIS